MKTKLIILGLIFLMPLIVADEINIEPTTYQFSLVGGSTHNTTLTINWDGTNIAIGRLSADITGQETEVTGDDIWVTFSENPIILYPNTPKTVVQTIHTHIAIAPDTFTILTTVNASYTFSPTTTTTIIGCQKTCQSTDGDIFGEKYIYGHTYGQTSNCEYHHNSDRCGSSTILIETFCAGNEPRVTYIQCLYGCSNGMCLTYSTTTTLMTTTTTTTTSSTTTSTSTSTTTTIPSCDIPGDFPPCGEVTLAELVDAINLWSAGDAVLGDIVDLITLWSSPSSPPDPPSPRLMLKNMMRSMWI